MYYSWPQSILQVLISKLMRSSVLLYLLLLAAKTDGVYLYVFIAVLSNPYHRIFGHTSEIHDHLAI